MLGLKFEIILLFCCNVWNMDAYFLCVSETEVVAVCWCARACMRGYKRWGCGLQLCFSVRAVSCGPGSHLPPINFLHISKYFWLPKYFHNVRLRAAFALSGKINLQNDKLDKMRIIPQNTRCFGACRRCFAPKRSLPFPTHRPETRSRGESRAAGRLW